MRVSLRWMMAALLVTAAGPGASDRCAAQRPAEAVPAADWDAAFDRTEGWIGGDAIYSTPLPDGDVLWLFADTFLGQVRDGRRQPGVRMVNNTLARHAVPAGHAAPASGSVRFLWGSPPDAEKPRAWIAPTAELGGGGQNPLWYWVADALVVPGPQLRPRLLVFLWTIARTSNEVMGFRGVGNAVALIDDVAADWTKWQARQVPLAHAVPTSPDDKRQPQLVWGSELALETDADGTPYLLVYGYRQSPKSPTHLVLARVAAESIEAADQWRFRTADGWSSKAADAAALAEFVPTEFSVTRIEHDGRAEWALVHSEPWFGTRLMAQTAASPYGPWPPRKPVYQVPDIDATKKHFTYAAKAHPELSRPGELLVSYVVNSFDFGEAATNADIYRPRFVRVPLGALPHETRPQ